MARFDDCNTTYSSSSKCAEKRSIWYHMPQPICWAISDDECTDTQSGIKGPLDEALHTLQEVISYPKELHYERQQKGTVDGLGKVEVLPHLIIFVALISLEVSNEFFMIIG
ncbi:hypothetical protein Y1Q_0003480 [Alligator mississippiensis]|uniref:Uncharacterized protein n=1 Tax=Alligator mississippiensis TaxID=8496 RepID=A0A151M495_ALLMI|nr:hypothetical protein Y1Q_0003480 [Alligator mississippiensis]